MPKTSLKKQSRVREESSEKELLDRLTFAFAEEIERETGESHLNVLESIADTAESLSAARRRGRR
jgi:hypothetical protein